MFGRRLLPKAYTIRSATTGSAWMTSWRFEASNDLVNWLTLDTRYGHLHTTEAYSAICTPGGTTTWGIDVAKLPQSTYSGFSAFRVV